MEKDFEEFEIDTSFIYKDAKKLKCMPIEEYNELVKVKERWQKLKKWFKDKDHAYMPIENAIEKMEELEKLSNRL